MIDKHLLRICKHREQFVRLRGEIPDSALDAQTKAILADFGDYFDAFREHTVIDMDVFLPRFSRRHPTLTKDALQSYHGIFAQIVKDVDDETRAVILHDLHELQLGTKMAELLGRYDAGDVSSFPSEMSGLLDAYKRNTGAKEARWIDDSISDLLLKETDNSGVNWRLECLNQCMRGLRPGDFGIVAGRPDKGKTTLLTSEVTFMAPQLQPDRNLLWLNNEGPGARIIPRLYQAALGLTMSEMLEMNRAGTLVDAYRKAMGGRIDRIRVVDIHGMTTYQVESVVDTNNAGLIVYDMIDNIRGFGDAARTDLMLEKMYQWGRDIAVKYESIGMATSQISAEGDGLQFPTMPMLKDSKTGKQGACDFMLMIGASNDVGLQSARYIGLPKNKLRREGSPGDPRATVSFRPDKARYEDVREIEDMDAG